jgi:hypothetical protein
VDLSFLNPFINVLETTRFPLANAYRTTLPQKIWRAAEVFAGVAINEKKGPRPLEKTHVGIFDWLTLGSTALLLGGLGHAQGQQKEDSVAYSILGVLIVIVLLPRLLFAGIMILACLPFIAIVHGLTHKKGNEIKEKLLKAQVNTDAYKLYWATSTLPLDLSEYKNSLLFLEKTGQFFYINDAGHNIQLASHKLNLDYFKNNFKLRPIPGSNSIPSLVFTKKGLQGYIPSLPMYSCNTYHSLLEILKTKGTTLENIDYTAVDLDKQDKEIIHLSFRNYAREEPPLTQISLKLNPHHQTFFKYLCRLNIGGLAESVESRPELSAYSPLLSH